METTITINKLDVFNEVGRATAYYGLAEGEGAPGYDTAAVTPDDWELLEPYWRGARNDIIRIAKRFAPVDMTPSASGDTSSIERDFKLRLTMPSSWDTANKDPLRNAIRLYLIHDITAKWAMRAIPAAFEGIAALSKDDASSVSHLLHHTLRPTE